MYARIKGFSAIALAGFLSLYPQISGAAESFTSAEFLEWPAAKKNGYIVTSATMAGVIVAQVDPVQARCVDDWLAQEAQLQHRSVKSAMRQFSNYHPQGVILWVIQNECGEISPEK